MKINKKVSIIGAGPGGLASAMLLSSKGFDVTVFEKQPYIGGRTSRITLGDYSFDMGPTFFMMPQLLEELFESVDRNLHDYVEVQEVDPLYTLKFEDGVSFSPTRKREEMVALLKQTFPGNEKGYERFMTREAEKFDSVMKLLQQPFSKLTDYLSLNMLTALPKINALDTVYGQLSTYFTDERLKWAFSFQTKYLGMSAWNCPGTFTILSYLEHGFGLFHPKGGLNQLCKAMADVTLENGGTIKTGTGVKKVIVKNGVAVGLHLENGK